MIVAAAVVTYGSHWLAVGYRLFRPMYFAVRRSSSSCRGVSRDESRLPLVFWQSPCNTKNAVASNVALWYVFWLNEHAHQASPRLVMPIAVRLVTVMPRASKLRLM
jgi:hypothetical protein